MSATKNVTGDLQVNCEFIHLSRFQQFGRTQTSSRKRARMTPSVMLIERPSGYTSVKRATKSVSEAELAANSFTTTGPVTSVSAASSFVVKSKTSLRDSMGRWS